MHSRVLSIMLLLSLVASSLHCQSYSISEEELTTIETTLDQQNQTIEDLSNQLKSQAETIESLKTSLRKSESTKTMYKAATIVCFTLASGLTLYIAGRSN